MSTSYDAKPWYVKEKKKKRNLFNAKENLSIETILSNVKKIYDLCKLFKYSILTIFFVSLSTYILTQIFNTKTPGLQALFLFTIVLILLISSIYLLLAQIGSVCAFFTEGSKNHSHYKLGYFYLTSQIEKSKPRANQMAPELVLKQFVQQVRLYSLEKNYYIQKQSFEPDQSNAHTNPQVEQTLLDRRWSDIQDTLDEFDIYLSQNTLARIETVLSTLTPQLQDVSLVFQSMAEAYETAWRPKGVNIEHAIVVPLKANINTKLLKRLLAGPWRSSAYFVPKGGTVSFSAKNEDNKIKAQWDCLGVTFSPLFYETIRDISLSINSRIEIGITYISNQPQSSNILFGLISLIIWNDLATAAGVNFNVKQGDEGMIITLTL